MQVLVSSPKTSFNIGISTFKKKQERSSILHLSLLQLSSSAPVGNWSNVELSHIDCAIIQKRGVCSTTGNSQRGNETSVKMREKHSDFACTASPKTEKPRGRSFHTDFEKLVTSVVGSIYSSSPELGKILNSCLSFHMSVSKS